METKEFLIDNISCVSYGKKTDQLFIYIHGKGGSKESGLNLAQLVEDKGYQVIAFDLLVDSKTNDYTPWLCKEQLTKVYQYLKNEYQSISLYAISLGAYFSLITFQDITFKYSILVSPVVNMKNLIENMMLWASVDYETLKQKEVIQTSFGETLYIDYYQYVLDHPILKVNQPTFIIYPKKDHLTSMDIMQEFITQHNCQILVMENSEHYIHLPEELGILNQYLNTIIK